MGSMPLLWSTSHDFLSSNVDIKYISLYIATMASRPVSPAPVVVAAALSIASTLASSYLLRSGGIAGPARLPVALLPVPFFLGFLVAELRWVRQCDEFHRGVILESLAIAFPAAILLAVTIEAVQKAGYLAGWTVGEVWPFMALLWLPGLWLALRRYR